MPRKKLQVTATLLTELSQEAKLSIDGHTYPLVVTNGALIEFERLTGISTLTDLDQIFGSRPTLFALSSMTYVLLKRAGCKLSQDEVVDSLTPELTSQAYKGMLAAWAKSRAEAEPTSDPKPATT